MTTETPQEYWQELLNRAHVIHQSLADYFNGAIYPPASTGWVLVAAVPLGLLLIGVFAGVTLRRRAYLPWWILLSAGLLVPSVLVMFWIPTLLTGQPDQNCQNYNHGRLSFQLVSLFTTPANIEHPDGPKLLMFVVKAPDRFGNQVHTCQVPVESAAKLFQDLLALLQEIKSRRGGDGYLNHGKLVFSFGKGIDEHSKVLQMPGMIPDKGKPDKPIQM